MKTSAHNLWRRQDIVGLIAGAYALLLHPSASALTSPKMSGRSPPVGGFSSSRQTSGGGIDIRRNFRSCLEASFTTKSLTFARVVLLPSFGASFLRFSSPSVGNVEAGGTVSSIFDFYISVMTEFTSRYLDTICAFGELPISRAQWYSDEEKDLQLRRMQEDQRRQFGLAAEQQQTSLPTEVDVTKRFDCIDDVVALAVAVCSACPGCAHQFWSILEDTNILETGDEEKKDSSAQHMMPYRLFPSRALKKLERVQADDESLLATYLSFLSAVALATSPNNDELSNGAASVHSLLSSTADVTLSPITGASRNRINWSLLFNMILDYANELSRAESNGEGTKISSVGIRRSTSGADETDGRPSTAYYYGADSNATQGQETSYSNQQGKGDSSMSSSVGGRGRKELNEADKFILRSIISLISHVSSGCMQARLEILEINLGAACGADAFAGAESSSALHILFSLLVCPLPPDVRGLVFAAIANLIRGDHRGKVSDQDKEKIASYGKAAWGLLELSQILPIGLLEQYSPMPDASRFTADPGFPGPASNMRTQMKSPSFGYGFQVRI